MTDETGCRVYWGSHGCEFPRGHNGDHECGCCDCEDHGKNRGARDGYWCVAKPPYYSFDSGDGEVSTTFFYGEDAEALGLPLHPALAKAEGK